MNTARLLHRFHQYFGARSSSLGKRYLIAVSVIIISLISGHTISTLATNQAEQREYSEKIAHSQNLKLQDIVFATNNPKIFIDDNVEAYIRKNLAEFQTNHDFLNRQAASDSVIAPIYNYGGDHADIGLNELVRKFVLKTENFLAEKDSAKRKGLFPITELTPLRTLNKTAGKLFEAKAVLGKSYAKTVFWASDAFVLFVLLIQMIFIFWPAHFRATRSALLLNRKNKSLECVTSKLNQQNKKLKEQYLEIGHHARHDWLTNLANRRYLSEYLAGCIDQHRKSDNKFTILHIDLDGFKKVNDTKGHNAGDEVLRVTAKRLAKACREIDFVARIGGDEFVIILTNSAKIDDIKLVAERILKMVRQTIYFEKNACKVRASIGIEVVDPSRLSENPDVGEILVKADIALYEAKQNGKDRYEFFSGEMQAAFINQNKHRDEVKDAIEKRQLVPFYQPQFDAKTHKMVGMEALVRWRHPTRGILTPYDFLPIAADMGLSGQIDRQIIRAAIHDIDIWRGPKNRDVPKVAINLDGRSIDNPLFIPLVEDMNIRENSMSFEITETSNITKESHQILSNVERLKELGFDIEIDDFGTGHASILCLQYIKPKRLKIDREFIFPIVESKEQRRLVESILELAKPFNVEVVAEGVETMKHAEILRDLGVHTLQGYAFYKAISAVGISSILSSTKAHNEQNAA